MPTGHKLDLYKKYKGDYVASTKPALITVKRAPYLAITGRGEPGGQAFQAKMSALYGAAFTIKMARKAAGRDYAVCKLEGLWWGKRKTADLWSEPKAQWNWNLMIRVPDFIKQKDLDDAVAALIRKGKGPEVTQVKLETIDEGNCVQMLHVGPYDAEPDTIARMLAFARQQGLSFRGLHHEIYLSDPRRVAPEKLRTILRHPVGC